MLWSFSAKKACVWASLQLHNLLSEADRGVTLNQTIRMICFVITFFKLWIYKYSIIKTKEIQTNNTHSKVVNKNSRVPMSVSHQNKIQKEVQVEFPN